MSTSIRDKLAGERAITDWRSLKPHHEKESLFLVDDRLDLLDAAVAVAEDDAASIKRWLTMGWLARPTDTQAQAWTEDPDDPFAFFIVQPFVLAARVDDDDAIPSTASDQ